jgi:hypothetical protein
MNWDLVAIGFFGGFVIGLVVLFIASWRSTKP